MADKTVVVRIVVRANQFSSGLKGAAANTQKFAVDVERASERAGSSALALGAASATAGKLMLVGIGGAMAVSAKAAIDFESSLAGVAKTTDLAGSAFARADSPLASFGEALRSLSQRIPVNVNDLARIAEMGGQLGIEVPNLIEFTEVMAALGVSTNLAGEEAATGLARFTNIMGTAQDQFGRLGSVIVELGNNLATTESEILTFGLRLAPVGRTVGLTEEEVLGLSGALTQLGIPAERGGTALQRFFLDMQQAVEQGGSSLETFADVANMTADEFAEAFRESPAEAFTTILQGLDSIQEAGGSTAGVLEGLGVVQQRSIQVLLAASNGWETVAEAIDLANDAGAEGNALFEEAAKRYGTSASQIQILSNAFNDLRIEVGNALLGSGGLAAGLDFLREFIRIVKDNLPMVGRLAAALATVAAIRIGAGIVMGLQEGIDKLRQARTAADGLTRGMAAARLGMLGVNTAVFGAVAIASILITRWAMAAAKAAELRRQARLLQEQIDEGQNPHEALIDLLREENILTEERRRILADLGISEQRFAEALFGGERLSAFGGLKDDLEATSGALVTWNDLLGITGESAEGLQGDTLDLSRDLKDLFNSSQEVTEGFKEVRTNDIRNAFIEAGLGIRFTTDELDRMAEHAARTQPFDMDPGDIASRIANFDGYPELTLAAAEATAAASESNEKIGLSWQEMVMGMEDGTDRIEDFFETVGESTEDFRTTLEESFDEVSETIRKGFPAWDEYEQMSIDSLKAVTEAQDLYLEDLRDGFELQSELTNQVSDQVLSYIEGLDPATKGALARFRRTNKTGFDQWLADTEANLTEQSILIGDFWNLELPSAQEVGFQNMFATAMTEAKKFNLPGKETATAIMEGVQEQMQHLSETEQAAYLAFVAAIFSDEAFLRGIGLDIGDPIVQGILQALGTLPQKAAPVISSGARKVKEMMEKGYDVRSPSKMTQRIGMEITRGLFVGMDDEMARQLRSTDHPIVNIVNPSPSVTVKPQVQSGSRDLHIYYPQHTDNDISDAIQKSSFLGSIQRVAETTPGSN